MEKNPPSRTPSQRSRHSRTILVAEDEKALRKLIVSFLRMKGYYVLEVENGKEALEICKRRDKQIDLLLTNLIMPEVGGQELVECFAKMRPETKVIVISGYSNAGIPHQPLMFIPKPFSLEALLNSIRQLLQE